MANGASEEGCVTRKWMTSRCARCPAQLPLAISAALSFRSDSRTSESVFCEDASLADAQPRAATDRCV